MSCCAYTIRSFYFLKGRMLFWRQNIDFHLSLFSCMFGKNTHFRNLSLTISISPNSFQVHGGHLFHPTLQQTSAEYHKWSTITLRYSLQKDIYLLNILLVIYSTHTLSLRSSLLELWPYGLLIETSTWRTLFNKKKFMYGISKYRVF